MNRRTAQEDRISGKQGKNVIETGRKRRAEMQALTGKRMIEGKGGCVEHQRCLRIAWIMDTVNGITEYRMP